MRTFLTRTHPRYQVRKVVSYQYGARRLLTLTLDLGLGGMRIKAHSQIPKGDLLNVKLPLGEEVISLKGKVIHCQLLSDKQIVVGIQFVKISPQDYSSLKKYLSTPEEWLKPRDMVLLTEGNSA